MAKDAGAETNLAWAAGGILFISTGCAVFTSLLITQTLESLQSSQTMALLLTDGGRFISDDARLGDQLTSATRALQMTCDVSCALAFSSLMAGGALIWRLLKMKG